MNKRRGVKLIPLLFMVVFLCFSAKARAEVTTGWNKIDGKYYYYSADGYFYSNGNYSIDGKLYAFDENGVMLTGWIKNTRSDEDGIVRTSWYHASPGGVLDIGWKKINDKWYYFDQERTMKTGWLEINGRKYYLGTSGVMQTGWTKIDGATYFFKDNGVMASSQWVEGYWLNNDGTWTYKYKASWKKDSNGWRYEDTSGWYARNATITIDGKRYTFDANGYWVQ